MGALIRWTAIVFSLYLNMYFYLALFLTQVGVHTTTLLLITFCTILLAACSTQNMLLLQGCNWAYLGCTDEVDDQN